MQCNQVTMTLQIWICSMRTVRALFSWLLLLIVFFDPGTNRGSVALTFLATTCRGQDRVHPHNHWYADRQISN